MNRQEERNCIAYFQSNKVWKRLFQGFWEKYRSYGFFSGTVVLRNLSMEEIEGLEGFFGKSFHGKKSVSVSADRFAKALSASRFAQIAPEQLLELYFQKKLIGKKEERLAEEQQRALFLEEFQNRYQGTPAWEMLTELLEVVKGCGAKLLQEWKQQMELGAEIINSLPYREGKMTYLAVFATQMTGNPHAFDGKNSKGTFLLQLVQAELAHQKRMPEQSEIFPAFFRQRCFLEVGILLDDVSNYTMVSGVRAHKKDGSFHAGVEGFYVEGDMVQVPLLVLSQWEKMICEDGRIYIVENPSVFATLCKSKDQKLSCMCMNGQPRLAGLVTLDLLAAADTVVYYAGDLDPEGLLIAQKIAHYYKGEFHYWHMSLEDYRKSRSKERISEKRLKSLERITDEKLLPVVELMRQEQVAGYQETLLCVPTFL